MSHPVLQILSGAFVVTPALQLNQPVNAGTMSSSCRESLDESPRREQQASSDPCDHSQRNIAMNLPFSSAMRQAW
jgi:hypothetical protein